MASLASEAQRWLHFARALRNNPTPAEEKLWRLLSRVRPRFTRQLVIGPFVADFACRRTQLIVEVDGSQHGESEHDVHRAAALEADGWHVVRFWNSDVADNLDGVIEAIVAAVLARLPEDRLKADRRRMPRDQHRPFDGPAQASPPALAGGAGGGPFLPFGLRSRPAREAMN